ENVGPTQGPLDTTDDLVVAYADDISVAGDSLFVLRGDGVRPSGQGVHLRPVTVGRDVRIDYVTTVKTAEWGSQAVSIEDLDGDGARDLVISAYRASAGQVLIVSGALLGNASGVATTSDAGVVITTLNPGAGVQRFGAVIAARDGSNDDIDGD